MHKALPIIFIKYNKLTINFLTITTKAKRPSADATPTQRWRDENRSVGASWLRWRDHKPKNLISEHFGQLNWSWCLPSQRPTRRQRKRWSYHWLNKLAHQPTKTVVR